MNLRPLLNHARDHARAMRLHQALPFARVPALRGFLGVLPCRAHADGWDVIEPRAARPRDWRLIIPVLAGEPAAGFMAEPDAATGVGGDVAGRRMESALWGEIVLDLLAVDQAMARPPRRMLGRAPALGFGALDEATEEGDEPVLIASSLQDWFARLPYGPCLPLGDPEEQAATLRRFAGGIIASDVAHGVAVEKLLRRPVPAAPKIMVAA